MARITREASEIGLQGTFQWQVHPQHRTTLHGDVGPEVLEHLPHRGVLHQDVVAELAYALAHRTFGEGLQQQGADATPALALGHGDGRLRGVGVVRLADEPGDPEARAVGVGRVDGDQGDVVVAVDVHEGVEHGRGQLRHVVAEPHQPGRGGEAVESVAQSVAVAGFEVADTHVGTVAQAHDRHRDAPNRRGPVRP